MDRNRILVAEDEGVSAMEIKSSLMELGYEVVSVVSRGEDAVKKAAELLPDLVLMDIKLAGDLDGIEAAQMIRVSLDVPIVYLTANADENTIKQARVSQPYGFLIKPFNILAVNSTIQIALYKHEADIQQKRAEEAASKAKDEILRSEKRLNDITSSIAEGIYVMDRAGHLVFMNPEAERLLGWALEELDDGRTHDLIHYQKADGTPLPLEECPIHNVIRTGRSFVSSNEVFIRKDGTVFPVSVIASPIMEDGVVVSSVAAFRDISIRKGLEKEREKLIAELKDALAKVKQLSGLLPICASCKKIRDDKGYWTQIESYIYKHSEAEFSHGICPECAKKLYPQYYDKVFGKDKEEKDK